MLTTRMLCRYSGLLIVLLITAVPSRLMAQSDAPVAIAVMRPSSYRTVQLAVNAPRFPNQLLRTNLATGARVTNLQTSPAGWTAIVGQATGLIGQEPLVADTLPRQAIAAKTRQNGYVTSLNYYREEWGAILTAHPDWHDQQLRSYEALSQDELAERFQQGYAVTALAHGPDRWHVVMARGTGRKAQYVLTSQQFPEQEIRGRLEAGWQLSHLKRGPDKRWVIILAKRLNQPGPQRLKVSYDAVPKGWIQSGWRDGLTLQQLWLGLGSSFDAMGNVKYWRRLVETPEYADSSWYKDFIRRMAPRRDAYTAVRKMAAPFIREGAYAEAAQVFARYRERFPRLQAAIDSTIALLRRKPSDLQPQNLGMGVNSPVNEYEPVPSADGQRLYFTGQGRMEKLGGEDIYVAEWQGDRWGDAELLPRPLNTKEYNESANAVSADGTKLYAFANHKSGPGSGDNFVARRQAEGWGPLQPLKRPINSPHFDSEAMESGDGQALFFVSDRPGGQGRFAEKGNLYLGSTLGNTDIYVSRRTDTGWAAPINLGAVINTPFAERSPYLHPDGRTLYFSSAGHNSIGGLDVFVSRRKHADSWTEWTEPVNLGKAINTPDDDWGYRVATDGDRAYFAKMNREDTGSAGHNDLYSIRLPERVQPDPVVKVRGKILAPDSTPIGADLRWTTPARQQPVASQASDPADGSYFTILTPGRQYTLRAEAPAYHGATGSLDLREVTGRLDTNLTLVLAPRPSAERTDEATGGDPPASDNASGAPAGPADTASRARRQARVYFATDRAALQPEAPEQLRPLLTYLRAHPSARLRITGHTDSRATEPYNRRLAERRAEAAARWFRQQGIAPARMTTRSAGENQPIAPNTTPSGRAKNRRAVVKIVPGE